MAALVHAMRYACHLDGYELACALEEGLYCDPDEILVGVLATARQYVEEAHGIAVRVWVKETGIRPAHGVGDQVVVTHPARGRQTGIVDRVDETRAEYIVRIPALGHTKEGVGPHGWIIPWEEVDA